MFNYCPKCKKAVAPDWNCCPYCRYEFQEVDSVSEDNKTDSVLDDAIDNLMKFAQEMQNFEIEGGVLVKFKGDMEEVTIPDGVTVIGVDAFSRCEKIKIVNMPDSVTEIRDNAFLSCKNLTSVTLSKNLHSIGKKAFYYCASLQTIDFPLSLYEIGPNAFQGCGLTSLTFPRNITLISDEFGGQRTFAYNYKLTKVVFSGDAIELGHFTFLECKNLRDVTGLGKFSVVGHDAFAGCTSLERIDLPYGVALKEKAFAGSGLKEIIIPDDAKLAEGVFQNCTELRKAVVSGIIKSINESDNGAKLPQSTFSGCVNLQSLEIKSGIEMLDYSALDNCKSLEKLILPNTLKEIRCSLSDCASLKQLLIPDSVTKVYDRLLCGEYSNSSQCGITDITIGRSVKDLEFLREFCHNSQVERVTLLGGEQLNANNKAVHIFAGYTSLKYVSLPNTLKKLDSGFIGCESLEEIVIPDSVYEIADGAFSGCTKLRKIKLSNNLNKIGGSVFNNCISLESITLPGKLFSQFPKDKGLDYHTIKKVIGEWLFLGCVNLKTVYVPEEFSYIEISGSWFDAPEQLRIRYHNSRELARLIQIDEKILKKYQ